MNAPDPSTLKGKRDCALLALLVACGLCRAELLRLEVEDLQQRDGRWFIPDLFGKGHRRRTVPNAGAGQVRIDLWLTAAKSSGR